MSSVPRSNPRQARQSRIASFLALAFLLFVVLFPALHRHAAWAGRTGSHNAAAAAVTASGSGAVLRADVAADSAADCPLCDWLISAAYVAGAPAAALLLLLIAFAPSGLARRQASLCARPAPRQAPRAPPVLVAAAAA